MSLMCENVDWLQSHMDVCKVALYSPKQKQKQDQKVICFMDVSNLKMENKDGKNDGGSTSGFDLAVENLKERDIIVIKDTKKQACPKAEASVCFFKQASSDPRNVLNWPFNDLQKYALCFHHALITSDSSSKHQIGDTEVKQHKLASGKGYNVYANELNMDCMANQPQNLGQQTAAAQNYNTRSISNPPAKSPNTQRAGISPESLCSTDDLDLYVNQLSSLVMQMGEREIKDKLRGGSKCFHHSICPPPGGEKGKYSLQNALSTLCTSEMAHDAWELTSAEMRGIEEECQEGGQKTLMHSELIHKSKRGGRQLCPKDSKELADCISNGIMDYANQVASDTMISVLNTLKVHTSGKPISACMILKKLLLKHTREIVSDLIDSCMKNLHNTTLVLMTDSDFVSAVKRNLFTQGKQRAADIMEVILEHLVTALLGERTQTKSQSLSYAPLTAESHGPTCKKESLELSTVKADMKETNKAKIKADQCKPLTTAEKAGEYILKGSLTKWNQKQGNQGKVARKACTYQEEEREKISLSTDSLAKDLMVSALRLIQHHLIQQAQEKEPLEEDNPCSTMNFMTQSAQYRKSRCDQSAKSLRMENLESHVTAGPSNMLKETPQAEYQKLGLSNIIQFLIQKLLTCDSFKRDEPSEGENKCSEPRSKKATSVSKRGEEQSHDDPEVDFVSGLKQMSGQILDELVQSVMKLCLIMAKYRNSGEALDDLKEQAALANNHNDQGGGTRRSRGAAMSWSHQTTPGLEVIVSNQSSTNSFQKQLQAVLQWMAASQFNVPMLYFMEDHDGQLEKLPEVSAKATEKGYSVGDLLTEVMNFAKEQQLNEALGNTAKKHLLDWLLTKL